MLVIRKLIKFRPTFFLLISSVEKVISKLGGKERKET